MHPKFWNQRMSEEQIKHREDNADEGFEHQDLSPNAVYAFLASLAVAGILIYFVIWGAYHVLDAYEKNHQPPQNPLIPQTAADTRIVPPDAYKKFPQPRLERNERLEINEFRLHEEQKLNSYGWVDQNAGVVRIPITQAMQLIAQRGLPTTPKAGSVPPSEVNVVNQAARRADVSNISKEKKKK